MNKLNLVYEKISEMHSRGCKAAVFVNLEGDTAVTAPGCSRFAVLESDPTFLLVGVYTELAKVQDVREDLEAAVVELVDMLATETIDGAARAAVKLDLIEA